MAPWRQAPWPPRRGPRPPARCSGTALAGPVASGPAASGLAASGPMAFLARAAGRHGVLLAVLFMALLACVAPRCDGLLSGQHTGHATHGRDHAASPPFGPQPQPHAQPQPPPLQPGKSLVLQRAAALGPRLRRQLRFAEAPTDEDDADAEIGEAAERWLLSPHPGGGGSGGGGAGARAMGLDDFPPRPPHPKHLLYNAVLPSLPYRKRDGLDGLHGMHGHGMHGHGLGHHASYEELGPGEDIVNHHMLRTTRGNRQYDVPQIECPPADDGMERFACPTPDHMGRYRCIDDHVLCDGFIDCPSGEDEDRMACMFYKTTKAHLDLLADALLRWARGR